MAACIEDKNLWLVFEYVDGGSLFNSIYIEKKAMSLKNILTISLQIAEGMAFVHQMNVIHLDLKSKNILLGKYGIKVRE
jgi:serine/threonine protein kinase